MKKKKAKLNRVRRRKLTKALAWTTASHKRTLILISSFLQGRETINRQAALAGLKGKVRRHVRMIVTKARNQRLGIKRLKAKLQAA